MARTKWSVAVDFFYSKWTAFLMRNDCICGDVRGHVFLTGFFAGPGYWFRPLEARVEKATKRLLDVAAEIERESEEFRQREESLNSVAMSVVEERLDDDR